MAEQTVRVFLNRSCGPRGGKLYGPGWANVPKSFATAIGLAPEIEKTDAVGRPLPNTIAASVVGAASTSGSEVVARIGIPHPERDEAGDLVDPNVGTSALDRTAAAIADAAKSAERSGGQLNAETDAHIDASRELTAQPGHTAADSTSSRDASTGGSKPATKSALRQYGDADALRELAKTKDVKVKDSDTKAELVDKLYDAEVVL